MAEKDIKVGFGVDVDAVCGWIGSFGGEDSPLAISRGLFAGEVGVPRLLKLLEAASIKATWFTPGHSIETFPAEMQMVVEAGHEIGAHGYSHEGPIALSPRQEEDILIKSIELVEALSGKKPLGYTAPWWEPSPSTIDLLIEYGFQYDHSQMHKDFHPYYLRTGDTWTKIDYSKEAKEWMKPLVRGTESEIVEIPGSWYLDDLPPMMYIPKFPNSHGWVNPRDIGQQWKDQFDWVYREYDYAIFPISIHPDVSGRPQVLLMLEDFIDYVGKRDGVTWCTFAEIAEDFRKRSSRDSEASADAGFK